MSPTFKDNNYWNSHLRSKKYEFNTKQNNAHVYFEVDMDNILEGVYMIHILWCYFLAGGNIV